jgi:hypothetical protein
VYTARTFSSERKFLYTALNGDAEKHGDRQWTSHSGEDCAIRRGFVRGVEEFQFVVAKLLK